MSEPDAEQSRPRSHPLPWLGPYLKQLMADQTRLVQEAVAVEMVKLEAALNQEDVTMSDGFQKMLVSQLRRNLSSWRLNRSALCSEVDHANFSFTQSSPFLNSHGGRFWKRK